MRRAVVAGAVAVVVLGAGAAVLLWPPEPAATALTLTGDIRTHDPALVAGDEGEPWYVFSTGDVREGLGAPQIRRSTDAGLTWELVGTVWDAATRPQWAYEAVSGVSNFWAPEVIENDGTFYLYYSVSTFGTNGSAIGLTTNTTLDPDDPDYAWVDQGQVIASVPGETDYNAIDPGVVEDADGTPWMAFGSFWGGIQLVELTWPSGMPVDGATPVTIASRTAPPNAIEAPYLVLRDGWYYLFVSRDTCCRGSDSTYNMAVGRSREVTGPYVDRSGTDMTLDGGEPLLGTVGDMVGPGGQSVSRGHLAFHYYDAAAGGDFRLELRELAWDDEGWPVATAREEQDD
ncbi:arabinan endo-1,5-alpha-L-arabinosidase [Cellulomonas fengjieae]|uniref:arabinan endo-1,5-alpha-L-arabinosidase n=1 Tax=Cellulomonas fengjieae TaxID=2819978 RepID=UPI001AB01351|nr:arabinan endo-1,5-alpha-L-arabinosidase [Cellulomonas fengjieae]MBO3101785.1 arabinan endo-1,5-alpha-L-arabinosidase [Cellulomonas fengjieae]